MIELINLLKKIGFKDISNIYIFSFVLINKNSEYSIFFGRNNKIIHLTKIEIYNRNNVINMVFSNEEMILFIKDEFKYKIRKETIKKLLK